MNDKREYARMRKELLNRINCGIMEMKCAKRDIKMFDECVFFARRYLDEACAIMQILRKAEKAGQLPKDKP